MAITAMHRNLLKLCRDRLLKSSLARSQPKTPAAMI